MKKLKETTNRSKAEHSGQRGAWWALVQEVGELGKNVEFGLLCISARKSIWSMFLIVTVLMTV